MMSRSERFLQKLGQVTDAHLSDQNFGVKALCQEMEMSQPTLWRKVRELTELTPQEYIRVARLQRASKMLEKDVGTVTEIAEEVGFGNKSYFAKCFQEQFGVVPSLYRSKFMEGKKGHKFLSHPEWKTFEDN
jgi:AraC-like DNA-binding protein